eukprot:CAMPEP_0197570132 /NCGR_PEP_ID=MMETSP1320-20131121/40188_1 /TAXON_ID=91990 /ORGANISM="Bolidomonas sp., Strain RCC2347" /LENGTH=45 /DNA_ID= /DNA_START= /DNA_END= /DNA_ORIENTATION=
MPMFELILREALLMEEAVFPYASLCMAFKWVLCTCPPSAITSAVL